VSMKMHELDMRWIRG